MKVNYVKLTAGGNLYSFMVNNQCHMQYMRLDLLQE